MTPFADRTTAERLGIMTLCEDCGSLFRGRTSDGFSVAIGRQALAKTISALGNLGFECVDLYSFPLGTDKPSKHLRHDSMGFACSAWLIANFKLKEPTPCKSH